MNKKCIFQQVHQTLFFSFASLFFFYINEISCKIGSGTNKKNILDHKITYACTPELSEGTEFFPMHHSLDVQSCDVADRTSQTTVLDI